MQAGYAEYLDIRRRLQSSAPGNGGVGRRLVRGGEDRARWDRGSGRRANGVNDIRRLTASEIRAREPELSPRALEALLVPGEHVIDPWSPFLAYLLQAKAHGAEIAFATEVLSGAFDRGTWTLQTTTGERRARTVISIAPGLRRPLGRTPSRRGLVQSGRAKVNSSSSIRQLRSSRNDHPSAV